MQLKIGALLSYLNVIVQNSVYLIYTPFLIHYLGNSQFGIFQLANQTISTLGLLAVGFSGAYVKFYWEERTKSDGDVSKLNGLYLLFFGFISVLAILIGVFLMNHSQIIFNQQYSSSDVALASKMILIMAISVAINFVSSVFNSYIVANEKFIFQQSRVLISTLLQPLVVIMLLMFGFGVIYVALVQVVFAAIVLCLNIKYAFSSLHMKFSFGRGQIKLFLCIATFSGYIFVNQIVDLVNNSVPGLIVGKLLDPVNVAIYAVAIQIRTVFYQLSLALSNIFVPKMNELVMKDDNDRLNFYFVKVGRIQFMLLTFILGGFVLVGQEFLRLWAGDGYDIAYWMIIMMVFPVLIPLSQNLGIEIQRARNLHKFRSWIMAAFAVVNVIITILAVKQWGVIAAGLGYVVAISVVNLLAVNVYNHFKVGLNMKLFWRNILKLSVTPIVTTMIMLSAKFLMSTQSISFILGLGIVYSGVFVVLTWHISLRNDEKHEIKGILKSAFSRKKLAERG